MRLDTAQGIITLKSYDLGATNPGKFAEYTVNVKGWDPMSVGNTINEAFTKMVLKSAERLMYAAEVRVAVTGHTIDVYAT